jgi:hypothetical protein
VTSTNANGDYQFTGLPGNGNYFVTAYPSSDAGSLGPRTIGAIFMPQGGDITDQDIKLIPSVPPPPDVHIDTPFRAGDGTPAVSSFTGAPFSQTGACTGGSASWSLTLNGTVIASGVMTESPPGTYTGMIPPLVGRNGRATMNITIICPGGADKDDDFDIYIDPSGRVTNSIDDSPIEGATATLYRSDTEVGPFEIVPDGDAIMSPSNRTNPDLTDADGLYRWDVIAGYYKVRVEKAGCHAPGNAGQSFVESAVLPVPPPQFDIDLQIECPGGGPTNTPSAPTATFTRTPTSQGPPPTPTRTSTPLPPNGDANCNGIVDSIDVALILQFTAGLLNSLQCEDFVDIDDDGRIDTIDAALILQYIAGLLDEL